MSIEQIDPFTAQEILENNSEAIYVDVRSSAEFARGHPEKAINIPILEIHSQTQNMVPNPDFIKVSEAILPKDKPIIVGCQMGGRSQKACEILSALGFKTLSNVQGGFGQWEALGLPVSEENGEGISYESLSKKLK